MYNQLLDWKYWEKTKDDVEFTKACQNANAEEMARIVQNWTTSINSQ